MLLPVPSVYRTCQFSPTLCLSTWLQSLFCLHSNAQVKLIHLSTPSFPSVKTKHKRILPPMGLIKTLCNKMTRKILLKQLLILKRVVNVTIWHWSTLKPAIKHLQSKHSWAWISTLITITPLPPSLLFVSHYITQSRWTHILHMLQNSRFGPPLGQNSNVVNVMTV
jgi:hypothetical protein